MDKGPGYGLNKYAASNERGGQKKKCFFNN